MKICKFIALALALAMLLCLAACGEEKVADDPNTLVIGTNTAEYRGCRIAPDADGNDAIIIDFTYHNGGDEDASFLWSYYYTVTQGGKEMEYAVVWVSEDSFATYDESSREDVAPGGSLDVALTYKLIDKTTPIEINVTDLFDEEHDSMTIDPGTAVALSPGAAAAPEADPDASAAAPLAPDDGDVGFYIMTHAESDDPNNVIDAETMEMLKSLGLAMYVELREDGTGTFMLDDAYEISWGDGIISMDDEDVPYTVDGDTLTLTEDGTVFYFTLGDPSDIEASVSQGSEDFWLGDWYGWWTVTDGTGYYEDLIGAYWDCCAYFEPYGDNYLLTIWDTDFNDYYEDPLAEVTMELSGLMAFTENGTAVSVEDSTNFFWAGAVGEGEWYLDPGFLEDDDTVIITSEYEDSDGDRLEYAVTLTKWPSEWNTDVADAPEHYDSFFLPLMQEGGELPTVFEPAA